MESDQRLAKTVLKVAKLHEKSWNSANLDYVISISDAVLLLGSNVFEARCIERLLSNFWNETLDDAHEVLGIRLSLEDGPIDEERVVKYDALIDSL